MCGKIAQNKGKTNAQTSFKLNAKRRSPFVTKKICLISDNSLIVASVSDYYVKIFCVQKTLNLGHALFL